MQKPGCKNLGTQNFYTHTRHKKTCPEHTKQVLVHIVCISMHVFGNLGRKTCLSSS